MGEHVLERVADYVGPQVASLRDFINISNSPLAPELTLNPLLRSTLRWDTMLRLNKVYEAIHKPVMRIAEFSPLWAIALA